MYLTIFIYLLFVLTCLFAGIAWAVIKNKYNLAQLLEEDNGKPSNMRYMSLIALFLFAFVTVVIAENIHVMIEKPVTVDFMKFLIVFDVILGIFAFFPKLFQKIVELIYKIKGQK